MQLLGADVVAPFGETRGKNLKDRRALGTTSKQTTTGQLCQVMNWHAIHGKWSWTGPDEKEDAVRIRVESCHVVEVGVLAAAQDNDNVFSP